MSFQLPMSRRAMLGSTHALTLTSRRLARRAWASALRPSGFKERLQGPIVSIPTPFTAQFQVDHPAVQRILHQAQPHGMRIFDLTAGDGQFAYLSYEEIKSLTATVVEAVGSMEITKHIKTFFDRLGLYPHRTSAKERRSRDAA